MTKKYVFSAVFCLFVAFCLVATNVDGLDRSAPSGVAVASVPEIIDGSSYAKMLDKKINDKKQQALAELDKYKAEIDAIKADINTRKPGSEEYNQLAQKAIEKTAVAEAKKDYMQKSLVRENKEIMEQLYVEILAVSKEICQEKNIEVLLDRDEVNIPALSSTELSGMIQTHKVLYHAPNLDITKDIIERLDKRAK